MIDYLLLIIEIMFTKRERENSGTAMVAAWADFESGKWGGHGGGNISRMCFVKCLTVCQQTVTVFAFICLFIFELGAKFGANGLLGGNL